MRSYRYLVLLLILVVASGCKKDSKKEIINDFTTQALINGNWRSVLNDSNPATNPKAPNTLYWAVPGCRQDDLLTFTANGELLTANNNTVCTEDEPPAKQAYAFDSANKKLTINGSSFDVLELSTTRLKLSRTIPAATGFGYLVYVYEHP